MIATLVLRDQFGIRFGMSSVVFICDVCGREIVPADGILRLGGPERMAALRAARLSLPIDVYGRWRPVHDNCAASSDEELQELLTRTRDEHGGYLPEGSEEALEEQADWVTGSSPSVPLTELQTSEDLERWERHFSEKRWFPYTDWDEMVSRATRRP